MRDVLRDRQQWGREVMVSTGSPAATLAALDVLDIGGNAFDAAIAASAVLTVTLPMACGPAGDAAVVFRTADAPHASSLISLGRAPQAADPAAYRSRGHATVPETGILSVSTPALIDAWYALHRRHATLSLERLLEPAFRLAAEGTVITGQAARWGKSNLEYLAQSEFQSQYSVFGSPQAVGSVLVQPGLARLYTLVAEHADHPERLRAVIGRAVEKAGADLGGLIRATDCLADHAEFGIAPTQRVGDHTVATTPAPTQGPLLLQNLALYQRLSSGAQLDTPAGIHLLAEIVNQTYGWRLRRLGDPALGCDPDALDPGVLAELAAAVDPDRRSASRCLGHYHQGDTTQFSILDREGNGVSWVQSLGLGFGSGVGVPELGLLLCNRVGRSSTLQQGEPNSVAPGRRPVNTILPWLTSGADGLRHLGGTPGGDGQTQWNAQVLIRLLLDGCDPLQALSLPRWTYYPGSDKAEAGMALQLRVDAHMPADTVAELGARGHDVVPKASVGGVVRVVERAGGFTYGLDEGRHEGLTAGR
ncbi:gamma-glutamyltransferase [Streptomyces sp. NPDC059696]|uniref:gamma-glutamyltransferase n=1 Tax=Streptomyces sp. NPDC059696 TaxID=3346911 RepID=UPI003686B827